MNNVRTEVMSGRFLTGYKDYLESIAKTKTIIEGKRYTVSMLISEAVEKLYPPPSTEEEKNVQSILNRL